MNNLESWEAVIGLASHVQVNKKSKIFDQAENRMHVQQALLSCILS